MGPPFSTANAGYKWNKKINVIAVYQLKSNKTSNYIISFCNKWLDHDSLSSSLCIFCWKFKLSCRLWQPTNVKWLLKKTILGLSCDEKHKYKHHFPFSNKQTFSCKSKLVSSRLLLQFLMCPLEIAVYDDKLVQTKKKIQTDLFTFSNKTKTSHWFDLFCVHLYSFLSCGFTVRRINVTRIKIKRKQQTFVFDFEQTNVFKFQNIDHIESHICVRIASIIVVFRLFQVQIHWLLIFSFVILISHVG